MSNNSLTNLNGRKPTSRSEDFQFLGSNDIKKYTLLQTDKLKSETYIFAKRHGLETDVAEAVIKIFGNFDKAEEFTGFYREVLKGDYKSYLLAAEYASKNSFSYTPHETSLLEQEVMNSQNKFGIDPNQREISLIEKNGDLKPSFVARAGGGTKALNNREFVFNKSSLDYKGTIENSSHYSEHLLTKEPEI